MKKISIVFILCALTLLGCRIVEPGFSHAPSILDVTPMEVGGSTHLNITVWHDINISGHYVDTIEVTEGSNTTTMTIDPKPLNPDGTFTVVYNMGPVSGTPTINVRARCTITGYTGSVPWDGVIPEYASVLILPLLAIATFGAAILLKKHGTV